MSKPITAAVAKLICGDTLDWLKKKLDEIEAEHAPKIAATPFERRDSARADYLFHRSVYLNIALRQAIGSIGGAEAEEELKRILGTEDDHRFGPSTRSAAEHEIDCARRAARAKKSLQPGAAA